MTPSAAPPPTEAPRRRRSLPLPFRDPDSRSIQIGVAATLIIHLLLLLLAPRILRMDTLRSAARPPARHQPFNIRVIPPPPAARPPPPQRFVEANPNAPSNTPDNTKNFSFMNQQAAQEKPTPNHKSDMPSTQGRKDIESNQIVTGQLSKPQPVVPPAPQTPPNPAQAQASPRREQNPLPGFEKDEGKNPEGYASNVMKPTDNAQAVPNKVEGSKDAPLDDSATATIAKIDPNHPRARPTLEQRVRPAIFRDNQFGTENMGITALDARFNNYGVYLHRMLEIIQQQWDNLIDASRTYPPEGSEVTVTFRLNSKGQIVEIVNHKTTSNEQGTNACIGAIRIPAPYDKWTDDMIAVMGNETDLTIVFYYE